MKAATVALAISLASSAVAFPMAPPKIGTARPIRVPALPNPKFSRNGPAALRKAYLKYGVPVPRHLDAVVKKVQKRQATVGAQPQTDESEWLCPVTVGDTKMMLDFDTGSADLWVFSDEVSSIGSHASYPCKARTGGGGGGGTPGGGGGGLADCMQTCGQQDWTCIITCIIQNIGSGGGDGGFPDIPGIGGGGGDGDGDDDDDDDISDPFSDVAPLTTSQKAQKIANKLTSAQKKELSTYAMNVKAAAGDSSPNRFNGYTWKIQYGDGSGASGNVANDTVTIGGVSVKDHAVECASQASAQFVQSPNDGLLGLSFGKISTVMNSGKPAPQPTWFEDAVTQKVIPKGVFVADLKHKEEGSYLFGGMPSGVQEEAVNWVPVQSTTGFWQYSSNNGIKVNGKTIADKARNGAIADTGTTLLLMGNSSCIGYYKEVQGARDDKKEGGWVFPCGSTLPDLEVSVEDKWIKIPGDLVNYAETAPGSGLCYGGLQSLEDAIPGQSFLVPYIMGDILLKAIQAIFDKDNMRFGWVYKDHKHGK